MLAGGQATAPSGRAGRAAHCRCRRALLHVRPLFLTYNRVQWAPKRHLPSPICLPVLQTQVPEHQQQQLSGSRGPVREFWLIHLGLALLWEAGGATHYDDRLLDTQRAAAGWPGCALPCFPRVSPLLQPSANDQRKLGSFRRHPSSVPRQPDTQGATPSPRQPSSNAVISSEASLGFSPALWVRSGRGWRLRCWCTTGRRSVE